MNGRIPPGTAGKGDSDRTYPGRVIKDGATYKMWYSGYDGTKFRIYYAISPDGLNWAKYNNNAPTNSDTISTDGRIGLGTDGTGDDFNVYAPSVIKDGSTYKMWYLGCDGLTNLIYYATSPDGLTWTKVNNTVPDPSDTTSTDGRIPIGTSGKGDARHTGCPTVILDDSTYKMWYYGHDGTNQRIYHATSEDGLNWTKYSNSVPDPSNITGTHGRIPLGTSGGDTNYAAYPCVILDDSCYRLWYTGRGEGSKYCIYNATSPDGLTWTKVTNAVPVDSDTTSTKGRIPLGATAGRGDKDSVSIPSVIKDDTTYKMWYVGGDGSKYRTYLATSTDSLNWTKYDNTVPDASDLPGNGRIPLGTSGKGDDERTLFGCIIKDGSTYKMWYSGYDGNYRIYYATSPDGLIWIKYNNAVPGNTNMTSTDGRIPLGTAGTGDENGAFAPSVIKDGSTYKMWYSGYESGSTGRIYYATSSNGLTWTKYDNSIPADSNTTGTNGCIPLGTGGGDTHYVISPAVIKDGSTYKMWYSGTDGTNPRIYHATSSNGLNWTKYTNAVPDPSNTTSTKGRIPLGTGAGKGDTNCAAYPAVIKVISTYKMWYSGNGGGGWRIYYATSTDGLTWTKYTNAIPAASDTTGTYGRIPLGESGGDANVVLSTCVIKEGLIQEGYKYKMWYGGYGGGKYRIYLATCDQPPKACTIFYSW